MGVLKSKFVFLKEYGGAIVTAEDVGMTLSGCSFQGNGFKDCEGLDGTGPYVPTRPLVGTHPATTPFPALLRGRLHKLPRNLTDICSYFGQWAARTAWAWRGRGPACQCGL